ncbi:MAG: hypothetical protein ACSHX0_06880 [Akkermansiaceae bacterium]
MSFQCLSDAILAAMGLYLKSSGSLPAGVRDVKVRDWAGVQGAMEVILDADEPQEHELLVGVEDMEGELCLSVSLDDVKLKEDRQWMLGKLERVLRLGYDDEKSGVNLCFNEWCENAGVGFNVFEFKVMGSVWESEGRRVFGKVKWRSKAVSAA